MATQAEQNAELTALVQEMMASLVRIEAKIDEALGNPGPNEPAPPDEGETRAAKGKHHV